MSRDASRIFESSWAGTRSGNASRASTGERVSEAFSYSVTLTVTESLLTLDVPGVTTTRS